MNIFMVTGYTNISTGEIACIRASAKFENLGEAEDFAKKFPKSYRVKATTVQRFIPGTNDYKIEGLVICNIYLTQDEVNKGKNETGSKRIKSFLKKVPYEFCKENSKNSVTVEQMKSLIEGD